VAASEKPDNDPPAGGVSSGTFRVARDASEDSARLESLARFKAETTSALVHDMKQPLSAMLMNLEFGIEELARNGLTADARTALTDSHTSGRGLYRMIANLLDIARNDDGHLVLKRAPCPVSALFQRVRVEHEADARAAKVRLGFTALDSDTLDVDADILGRVLTTLVESSLRQTEQGGSIMLESGRTLLGASLITVTLYGAALPDESAHASTYTGSRGLGLYFCRVGVEAHGGLIDVTSHVRSRTTTYRIELPP
jgi:K+-sensing histidine kinase KdpD